MKKHIFGFVLFSFIVASFALVYTFLYAPSIPSKETVKPPISRIETSEERSYSCRFRRNKLSYEVVSSQYFVDENKIVSKVRINWDGGADLPSRIYVSTTFSSVGNIGKNGFGDYQIVENPFAEGREKLVTVVSKVLDGNSVKKDENLYVLALVTDYDSSTNYKNSGDVTQAKPVLLVYGKNSETKKVEMPSRNSGLQ